MRRVFKYPLHVALGGTFEIPKGAYFLTLQMQHGTPTMWWSVPDDGLTYCEVREFVTVGTGIAYDEPAHHVGTFQVGDFVGHVFTDKPFPRSLAEVAA